MPYMSDIFILFIFVNLLFIFTFTNLLPLLSQITIANLLLIKSYFLSKASMSKTLKYYRSHQLNHLFCSVYANLVSSVIHLIPFIEHLLYYKYCAGAGCTMKNKTDLVCPHESTQCSGKDRH